MIGDRILAEARGLVGTRWRHMGRGETGVDCIGLVLVAARRAGIDLPEPPPYRRTPEGQALRKRIAERMDAVPPEEIRDGDLLLFNMDTTPCHLGLAGTHPEYRVPSCVHAFLERRKVVEDRLDPIRGALTGVFRWREG